MPSWRHTLTRASVAAFVLGACGDAPRDPADTIVADAGEVEASDAIDADETVDARPPYEPPRPSFPSPEADRPFALSEVGLFDGDAIAPDLIAFEPGYRLWSDGLVKRRWLRLPAGSTIDNSDQDHWSLPVGAILFKEFALAAAGGAPARPLETRVIARTGPGAFDYWMGAFVWRADGSDADFVRTGAVDVNDTDHDVPSAETCWSCHVGTPGRVLGLATVQLAEAPVGALTLAQLAPRLAHAPDTDWAVPGDDGARDALGYLHANCAHCHNPNGLARPYTDLDLSLALGDLALEDTAAWRTAVGVATFSWVRPDYPQRVAPGDPQHSALIARVSARGNLDQMPPIASEHVDNDGVAILSAWIAALPNP